MSDYQGGVKNRRRRVIQRLETQLKASTKPEFVLRNNKKVQSKNTVELSDSDRSRIEKEITVLKTRI